MNISAASTQLADMPCAAGAELAAAVQSQKASCCIEQAGNNFGLISIKPQV